MIEVEEIEYQTKIEYQSQIFKNRVIKNSKHISKWARRKGIFAYRVYDRDIPEVPLLLDLYHCIDGTSCLNLCLYKRPYYVPYEKELLWLSVLSLVSAQVLRVEPCNVFFKMRERKKGTSQYQKLDNSSSRRFIVQEGEARFYVNFSDYIDTGLFLDHRPLRLEIASEARHKDVLNLFCYTASFSAHAMLEGARSVCSVDASKTAIKWAEDNMCLNGITVGADCRFVRMDVLAFLSQAGQRGEKWDIIICDPPTFSNSKSRLLDFDVNRDYLRLCELCIKVLKEDGVLYFSSNSKTLKFDASLLTSSIKDKVFVQDISLRTIPEDFRNKKIHRTWKIKIEN